MAIKELIANGLKESVEEVKPQEDNVSSKDVMNIFYAYETVSKLGENNTSAIFMPIHQIMLGTYKLNSI